jgi:hypothetical protein
MSSSTRRIISAAGLSDFDDRRLVVRSIEFSLETVRVNGDRVPHEVDSFIGKAGRSRAAPELD